MKRKPKLWLIVERKSYYVVNGNLVLGLICTLLIWILLIYACGCKTRYVGNDYAVSTPTPSNEYIMEGIQRYIKEE